MTKRKHQDPTTEELLVTALAAVRASHVKEYAIGGALAMEAHGYSRSTKDVDLFVLHEHANDVLRALRASGLSVMPVFAPHHYAAYVPGTEDLERRIDVLVPSGEPELSAIEWADHLPLHGRSVAVFPMNLLVFAKAYANRPEDETDLAAMLARGLFDPKEVRAIIASVDAEGAAEFDLLMRRITERRTRRPKPTKRIKRKS